MHRQLKAAPALCFSMHVHANHANQNENDTNSQNENETSSQNENDTSSQNENDTSTQNENDTSSQNAITYFINSNHGVQNSVATIT